MAYPQPAHPYSIPRIKAKTPFEAKVLAALENVLDPELDTSIVELGFIEALNVNEATFDVEMRLKLPTFWCAANFAYLMLWEARSRLLELRGIGQVRVTLEGHFADSEITDGLNKGLSFQEVFPDDASGDLAALRRTFIEKAYLRRHEILLELLGHYLDPEEIASLPLSVFRDNEAGVWLVDGQENLRLSGAAGLFKNYLERREKLGFPSGPTDLFCLDDKGQVISAEAIKQYLNQCRTTRINIDFNRILCEGLLAARLDIERLNTERLNPEGETHESSQAA
jgi:metal-sulfur cluster biosynthetic enzyme